jgi:hypothetical protein
VSDVALPVELVNPLTGELVPTADTAAVAQVVSDLREYEKRVYAARKAFSDVLLEESRRLGTKTLHLGAVTVKISDDHEVVWDIELLQMLQEAGLPAERYADLVTETVSYKVNGSVARQLAGASPEYAEIIDAAKGSAPKTQYVSVQP